MTGRNADMSIPATGGQLLFSGQCHEPIATPGAGRGRSSAADQRPVPAMTHDRRLLKKQFIGTSAR
jgi:hypothetical protein